MEITCDRCHQTLQPENCYCAACGLPQLQYAADAPTGQSQPERWDGGARDASSVDWKPALRAALLVAIPAGVLSSAPSPAAFLGLFWMTIAAGLAVMLYMREQRPAWITLGAGARIGLATGLLAGWLAFGVGGIVLFAQRFVFHHGGQIDAEWKSSVEMSQQLTQQWSTGLGSADLAQAQAMRVQMQAWMLSPEGHAGWEAFGFALSSVFMLLFAVAGGVLGARLLGRTRQPEV